VLPILNTRAYTHINDTGIGLLTTQVYPSLLFTQVYTCLMLTTLVYTCLCISCALAPRSLACLSSPLAPRLSCALPPHHMRLYSNTSVCVCAHTRNIRCTTLAYTCSVLYFQHTLSYIHTALYMQHTGVCLRQTPTLAQHTLAILAYGNIQDTRRYPC
jgi:hypothetical protein